MLVVSWMSSAKLLRGKILPKPMLWILVAMTFSGWIATLAGWYVTEIGRQPWLVYGVLTTETAVGTASASAVGGSLTMYLLLYAFLLVAYIYILFYLARQAASSNLQTSNISSSNDLTIGLA